MSQLNMDPRAFIGTEQFVSFTLRNGERVGGVVDEVSNGLVRVASPGVSLVRSETVFHQRDIVSMRTQDEGL